MQLLSGACSTAARHGAVRGEGGTRLLVQRALLAVRHGAVREEVGEEEREEGHLEDGRAARQPLRVLLRRVAEAALRDEVRGEQHVHDHLHADMAFHSV